MNWAFLDIETAPIGWQQVRDTGDLPPWIVPAAQFKNRKKPGKITTQFEHWRTFENSAKTPATGEIVAVGLAGMSGDVACYMHPDEWFMLRSVALGLVDDPPDAIWAAYGNRFDFPFIAGRAMRLMPAVSAEDRELLSDLAALFNRIHFTTRRELRLNEPSTRLIDPVEMLPTTSSDPKAVKVILASFGIAYPQDRITGADVLQCLLNDRMDAVRTHVTCDVAGLRSLVLGHILPTLRAPYL